MKPGFHITLNTDKTTVAFGGTVLVEIELINNNLKPKIITFNSGCTSPILYVNGDRLREDRACTLALKTETIMPFGTRDYETTYTVQTKNATEFQDEEEGRKFEEMLTDLDQFATEEATEKIRESAEAQKARILIPRMIFEKPGKYELKAEWGGTESNVVEIEVR